MRCHLSPRGDRHRGRARLALVDPGGIAGIYFAYSATVEEQYMAERFPDAYPADRASTKMLVRYVF